MTALNTKKGSDLQPGDRVITEEGETVRLTSVANGLIQGAVLVEWSGGWGHVDRRDVVEVLS